MDNERKFPTPHVLMFPLPLQGPVNCMLKLAELLSISGIKVTFLNTIHVQRRLLRHTDIKYRFKKYPNFRFKTVSDGLADDHPRTLDRFGDVTNGLNEVTHNLLKEMLISGGCLDSTSGFPVTNYFRWVLQFCS